MSVQAAGGQPGQSSQRNEAEQHGRVYAVQRGDQLNVEHLHLTVAARRAERAVSAAPPLGRRDPRRPLRGRDALVASLRETSHAASGTSRVRVLCGLAGSGKTAVALEVAYLATVEGVDVWWVDGSTETAITAGMLAVARQLGAPAEALLHGDPADEAWRVLRARTEPWLLVFDNADRPELLGGAGKLADGNGWLRPIVQGPGAVVVTTRDGDPQVWGPWCVRDTIGMLAPPDAVQVLGDWAGAAGGGGDARALVGRLGGLPLALRMCGAYLADAAAVPWPEPGAITTFDGYLAALGTGSAARGAGVAGSVADEHRRIVSRAWELSLDLLAERGLSQARPLLRVLSLFADAPVPYPLLLHPATLAASPAFAGLNGGYLWRLLRALAALGLVDLSAAGESGAGPADPMLATARVHPLVRQTSGGEPAAGYRSIAAELLVRLVAEGLLGAPHHPAGWARWQAVTVHALQLAADLPADPACRYAEEVLSCAIGAARHLRARGLFAAAEPAYRSLYAVGGRVLPPGHPHLALIRHELGYILYYRGLFAAAEREFRAVLAMRGQLLGAAHPDTLLTRQALGRLARVQGRYPEAERELRDVYLAQRALLGAEHPDTLTSQHHLARTLLSLGELADSRAELQRVLWRRRRTLGEAHPDTLLTRHQLAKVAYRQGRFAAAERQCRTVGALRRRTLGDDHPDTLHSQHVLALSLAGQGRDEEAYAEFRGVLDVRRRLLGDRHPDSLTTRHHLAGVLAALGHTAEAVAEYQDVLRARRDLHGDDHPDVRLTGDRLAELASAARDGKASSPPGQ